MDNLQIRRSLDLLDRLKLVAADFAKREERLTRGLETRRSGIAWRIDQDVNGDEERLAARLAEEETPFAGEAARVRDIARERAAWVRRASGQALRTLPRRARDARGNWLADQQMRLMRAETARATALQEVEAEAAHEAARLTEDCRRLILLKREARKRFTGYRVFRRRLHAREKVDQEGEKGLELLDGALTEAEKALALYREFFLPRVFRFAPPLLLGMACLLLGAALAWHGGRAYGFGGGVAAALFVVAMAIHALSRRQAGAAAIALAEAVVRADRLYEAIRAHGIQKHEASLQALQADFEREHADITEQWNRVDEIEAEFQTRGRVKIEAQAPRIVEKIRTQESHRASAVARERQAKLAQVREEWAAQQTEARQKHEEELRQWHEDETGGWERLAAEWQAAIEPLYLQIREMQAEGEARFPGWSEEWIERWKPPVAYPTGAKFADLEVDLHALAGPLPKDARLALPGSAEFSLPLALTFPQEGSLLIEAKETGHAAALGMLNALVLRLLAGSPPGKVTFTIVDPVGLGQNFAGLMYLSDYEESLINRRIWTQQSQIEERLGELNEHIEKMIQMYLRNEFATITEYNEKAGSVAEKYHFLVIADFPAQFSETAARRLQSIATSGPRCGVFTFIQWDPRQSPPEGLAIEELRKSSVRIQRRGDGFLLTGLQPETGTKLVLAAAPSPELTARLVHTSGRSSVDSNRVQVPFSQIAPAPEERWTNDTTQELKIAIGRTGATKPQYLAIGKGTRQHALFAGKTGSGKSTLFHVIITNLALACSPRQVEFYLIDFKKGVEFKCYAEKRLPHARVVAIESDREFALSVLQRVDEELRRRGDLFRRAGAQDVAGYKRVGGAEDMPRTLLIIDEFQEFFVEDDAIAQGASLLLDRIVRQGRAFGIHVLLGSQTLGGAYTLARATLGQMVIRVALQCNEADSYLIMDDNNPAPRMLQRPGEGIYNDAAGALEGNSPFQVVWLPEDERDRCLDEVQALAAAHGLAAGGPIVFEGNAPADIRDNRLLQTVLEHAPAAPPTAGRAWLGSPNSIKGPTEAVFHRQSGNHLLVVGQREEAALSIMSVSLLALGAQYPPGTAKFVFFQGGASVEGIARAVPHEITMAGPHESAEAMQGLVEELHRRMAGGAGEPMFVFVHGLHKFKKLRHEDDFSFSSSDGGAADPGAQFNELIREGSAYGMHLLVSIDSYGNVSRFISRKAMSEFEMRVVFQMSANDSASLIDSPRASMLGLHRALFFNEREGTLETFRPYALPSPEWIAQERFLARV